MCMLMLRCGLRVEEVAYSHPCRIDFKRRQIVVVNGKGGKGRVRLSQYDAYDALMAYLTVRPVIKTPKLFLVEKGTCRGHRSRSRYPEAGRILRQKGRDNISAAITPSHHGHSAPQC